MSLGRGGIENKKDREEQGNESKMERGSDKVKERWQDSESVCVFFSWHICSGVMTLRGLFGFSFN